jgi:TetR/AcrR family transcriptional regulator, lmrAB and yxaGH operons repressor
MPGCELCLSTPPAHTPYFAVRSNGGYRPTFRFAIPVRSLGAPIQTGGSRITANPDSACFRPNDRLPWNMRPSRNSRQEIVKKLSDVFRRESYSGASLADLAAAVGLGKASLYQKFPEGKAQMGAEVLTEIGRSLASEVLSVLRQNASPTVRFSQMLVAVGKFYNGGQLSCLIDTLSLGEAGQLYRTALLDAIKQWEHALADLARETGQSAAKAAVWAEEVLITIEGSLVLARAKNDPQVFRRALKRLGQTFANRRSVRG